MIWIAIVVFGSALAFEIFTPWTGYVRERRRLGRALPRMIIVSRTFTPIPGIPSRLALAETALNLDTAPCDERACPEQSSVLESVTGTKNDASGVRGRSRTRPRISVGGARPSGTSLASSPSRAWRRFWRRSGKG